MLPAQHTPQKHTRYDGAHSRPNKEKKFRHKSHTSYKLFGIPSTYLAVGAGLYAPIAVEYVYPVQRRCVIYNACNSAIKKSRRISAAPAAFRKFFFVQSGFKYVYLNPEFFFSSPTLADNPPSLPYVSCSGALWFLLLASLMVASSPSFL